MRVGKDEKCCINCAIQQDREGCCEECRFEHKDHPSLFYRITRSPETLAEHFVYAVHYGGLYFWHSTLIYPAFPFETKEAAIAATVEKLKEVKDGYAV